MAWQKKLRELTKDVGTYREAFEPIIETLATILDRRDAAYKEYIDSGAALLVEHTLDRGAKNMKPDPRLKIWQDLNAQALAYWRDLGLTPAGLKRINEQAAKTAPKPSALTEALKSLGG